MGKYPNESVLVIPRSLFDELGSFEGFCPDAERYLNAFLTPGNHYYLPRDDAEDDPTHKQIIPYAIFEHEGRILHYVRGKAGGEKRLAAKGSIGIGGHINTTDAEGIPDSMPKDVYVAGVAREVEEELDIRCAYTQEIVGLINDDSNEVGQVHLGIVHRFHCENADIHAREDAITDLAFLDQEELKARSESLESWSQICIKGLLS